MGLGDRPRVALVGTRSCTHYGESVAGELAGTLVGLGIEVVSGLDAGIESAVQRALLGSSAPNLAVAAGGLAPREDRDRLAEQVAGRGTLLSEAPPAAPPERWRYFRRNLLLSLLPEVLVVVEAHERGGVLALAEAAAAAGVTVAAVPGSVRSSASVGTNRLLAEGAQLVRDAGDVLGLLSLAARPPEIRPPEVRPPEVRPPEIRPPRAPEIRPPEIRPPEVRPLGASPSAGDAALSAEAGTVRACLEAEPSSLEALLARSGLPLGALAAALEVLVRAGLARRVGVDYELAGPRSGGV